jgi:uncharacterized membrane protein
MCEIRTMHFLQAIPHVRNTTTDSTSHAERTVRTVNVLLIQLVVTVLLYYYNHLAY